MGLLVPLFFVTFVHGLSQNNQLLMFMGCVLFILFTWLIKKNVYSEIESINSLLLNDLKINDYINFYVYASRTKNKKRSLVMKSALLQGYLAKGDFEKATPLFYEVRKNINTLNNPEVNINLLVSCTNYLLYTNQHNEAYELLTLLDASIKNPSVTYINKEEIFHNLKLKFMCATNQLTSIDEFNCFLQKTNIPLTKVELKFFLGNFFEANNNIESAFDEYKYVAKSGGDLYIAQLSKLKLEHLGNSTKNIKQEGTNQGTAQGNNK